MAAGQMVAAVATGRILDPADPGGLLGPGTPFGGAAPLIHGPLTVPPLMTQPRSLPKVLGAGAKGALNANLRNVMRTAPTALRYYRSMSYRAIILTVNQVLRGAAVYPKLQQRFVQSVRCLGTGIAGYLAGVPGF